MSRYIDADALKRHGQRGGLVHWKDINEAPSIDLADYVPKEFHDKTCEAMAKRHQEEIADMVSVVRCKECENFNPMTHGCNRSPSVEPWWEDDFCSYGERSE